jgi:hypothetical protein
LIVDIGNPGHVVSAAVDRLFDFIGEAHGKNCMQVQCKPPLKSPLKLFDISGSFCQTAALPFGLGAPTRVAEIASSRCALLAMTAAAFQRHHPLSLRANGSGLWPAR